MNNIMEKHRLAVLLLVLLLLSASTITFINYIAFGETQSHGTLILKGKDNADATKSAFVATYLQWLEKFTSKDLEVDEDGKVKLIQILNVTPPSFYLMEKLDEIIDSTKTVEITLDRSPHGVWFDAFEGKGKQTQDLDDLDALPDPPSPGDTSDSWDKAQQIAHTLNEGYYAAQKNTDDYDSSHKYGGIPSENNVRNDVGGSGKRILDRCTWGKNATHQWKSWYAPDPTDPTGERWIEVYREVFKLKDSGIERDAGGNPIITRIKNPPNPQTKVLPKLLQRLFKFIGRIVGVNATPSAGYIWTGEPENFQTVTYEVLQIIEGNYTEGYISVNHPIVSGSSDVDGSVPQLSSMIFYYGNVVEVEALFNAYAYVAIPPAREAPVGGHSVPIVVPVDKLGSLAPYIFLATTILVATVATAIHGKRVKRRKEKQ